MVWAINSRSPDLASESPNKSENLDIVRQFHWELSNFEKFFFIMDKLYEKLIFWGGGGREWRGVNWIQFQPHSCEKWVG